jgi:hypothetical protein
VSQYHLRKIRDAMLALDLPLVAAERTPNGRPKIVDAKGVCLFVGACHRKYLQDDIRDAQAICDTLNALQELLPHLESYAP